MIGAALVRIVMIPAPLRDLFSGEKPVVERIGFVALPKSEQPTPGRSGGNDRPETPDRPPPAVAPPALVAPLEIPSSLPTASVETPAPALDPGSGPIVGTPGPVRGVRPSFSDPRVWPSPAEVVSAPLSSGERLDSAVTRWTDRLNDSVAAVAAAGPQRKAGDWTFEKDGKKYGLDQQMIHLGKFSIPMTVLGMLPLNIGKSGNIQAMERERALMLQRREIMEGAQRAMNEEDFRKAVRAIRERKQRERDRELAARNGKGDAEKPKTATP